MKSLSQFVLESFFETKHAPGETVQFRPNTTDAQRLNLDDQSWYVGVVRYVKIDRFEQWFGIDFNGLEIDSIHELNVKQDINHILTNESLRSIFNESLLPSNCQIGDDVNFYPMYSSQEEQALGFSAEKMNGQIVSIKFTKAKVFYSIVDDYHGKLFFDIDSVNVWKPTLKSLPEA